MPNYTENELFVKGTAKDILAFQSANSNAEGEFTLENLIPTPQELLDAREAFVSCEGDEERIEKYGYPNLYEFRTNEWGTGHDVFDSVSSVYSSPENDNAELTVAFQTAWSPIEEWLKKAISSYPTLSLDYKSCDLAADWHYELHATNGEITNEMESPLRYHLDKWEEYDYILDYYENESSEESSSEEE